MVISGLIVDRSPLGLDMVLVIQYLVHSEIIFARFKTGAAYM
jgi:hypothetical protein